jgi:hypothetical protein
MQYPFCGEETSDSFDWFLQTLKEVGEFLGTPIKDNEYFNRDALPFHTVLQCRLDDLEQIRRRYGTLPVIRREDW